MGYARKSFCLVRLVDQRRSRHTLEDSQIALPRPGRYSAAELCQPLTAGILWSAVPGNHWELKLQEQEKAITVLLDKRPLV